MVLCGLGLVLVCNCYNDITTTPGPISLFLVAATMILLDCATGLPPLVRINGYKGTMVLLGAVGTATPILCLAFLAKGRAGDSVLSSASTTPAGAPAAPVGGSEPQKTAPTCDSANAEIFPANSTLLVTKQDSDAAAQPPADRRGSLIDHQPSVSAVLSIESLRTDPSSEQAACCESQERSSAIWPSFAVRMLGSLPIAAGDDSPGDDSSAQLVSWSRAWIPIFQDSVR